MSIRSRAALVAAVVAFAGTTARASETEEKPSEEEPSEEEPTEEEEPSEAPPRTEQDEAVRALQQELELLRLRLEALEATPVTPPPPPAAAPNVFNPRITGFIDLVGAVDVSGRNVTPSFDVRAFELDLRADIDPFAKAVVVLGFENPLLHALEHADEHEDGVDPDDADGDAQAEVAEEIAEAWLSVVEEANISFVALPAHLLLELGLVRVDFGGQNRSHLHDVPHIDYPGAMTALFGEEGWADAGVFLRYRLHNPKSLPIDFKVGVMSRGPEPLMEGRETPTPVLLGRFRGSADFGAGSLVSAGVSYSGWRDATDEPRGFDLAGGDFLLKLRPAIRGRDHSFYLQGEAYFARRVADRDSLGGFVGLGVQPARNVFLSLRADALIDDLADPEPTWGAGFAASLHTTEFLRVRLAYDLVADHGISHRFGAQVTAVFGSHPVEPYWVNR